MAHALVFGASGILGWAIVDQILKNYPQKSTFFKVTALTKRPLKLADSLWPTPQGDTPDLSLVSGIDLLTGTVEEMKQVLREKVPDIDTVSHIFWCAYSFCPDFPTERDVNGAMFNRGFAAAEALSSRLRYVILPTGTKGYGIHLPQKPFKAPFKESMGELPRPHRDILFYYDLRDRLDALQRGKPWKWAEVRVDVIVGFLPHSSPYNLAGYFVNYLSLIAFTKGPGTKVHYPAHPDSWFRLSNDAGQDIFAKFSLYLSLNPDKAGNSELYNIADTTEGYGMAHRWPEICEYFGLVGAPPLPLSAPENVGPTQYMDEHREDLKRMEAYLGSSVQQLDITHGLDAWMKAYDFDHHFLLDKARSVGFMEEDPIPTCWIKVFDRYRAAHKLFTARYSP